MPQCCLIVLALVVALSSSADACPPGPCTKYRHQITTVTVTATATVYVRSMRGDPPAFHERRLTTFLTTSSWEPVVTLAPSPPNVRVLPAPRIRFVDSTTVTS